MKSKIRQKVREIRRDKRNTESHSRKIMGLLFSLKEYKEAKTVLFYLSKGSEVQTKEMIKKTLKDKEICLPVTDKLSHNIVICRFNGFDGLHQGAYGILEPKDLQIVDLFEIDLVIIPGIAFDRTGARIGHGKGYYDKLLKNLGIPKIALAFSSQIVEEIPREDHDVDVDKIITENGVIDCDSKDH